MALEPTGPPDLDGFTPTVAEPQGCFKGTQSVAGSEALQLATAASSTVIGVSYDGQYFTGNSITWSAPTGCANGSYQVGRIGGGWNNRIRSSAAATCQHMNHFYYDDFGEPKLDCGTVNYACDTMAYLDRETSSIKWHN
jgi:hypothetical protein